MKKNIYFSALIALGLFAVGCAKDEGNYNYNKLNTNFVDTAAFLPRYSFKQNEVVNITPSNVTGVNNANLEYEWRLVKSMYTPDPTTGTYIDKQLATTKNLSYKFVEPSGDYALVLYVKDKTNGGITQMINKNIKILPFAMPGWMVLHSNGNSSDVSIIVNEKISNADISKPEKYVVTTGTDSIENNVYSKTNGSKLQDAAGIFSAPQNCVGIFTKTNIGGYRLSSADLRIKVNYSDMFMNRIPTSDVQFQTYDRNGVNELLINKGDVYTIPQPVPGVWNQFGIKCFGKGSDDKELDFVAAPYVATNTNSYLGAFYDTKNKRFLYVNTSREIKEFLAPVTPAVFDARNVGKEMVYAENGYEIATGVGYRTWYSIMQTPGNPNTRELFGLKLDRSDDGARAVTRIDLSTATEMNNAKYFAFGNKSTLMFYATDSKIYQYPYATTGTKVSTLKYDILANYPGNVITGIKLFKIPNQTAAHASDGKLLYIALYNATTQAGTILQIDVDPATGTFGTTVKAYPGFGKIVSMDYKSLN
ncbi:PKD-like family lipoprotein [Solitalea koreensis]|uniref:PKD-like family protein n=1 Tax=Solitalea koreensis TaxID=543615 RepID=A0A521AAX1_9SPHI|nr:PKD-like family lipoprotein [Solitalea koreensis]SMO31881.1 PKD-like family protein [Solitalea koreensis]